ncbi:MAG TPA: hypothetical protein VKP65_00470, partial [Rhodothermales bacterium]|nr:hypothetical protein [Rhodothermales bacterium]
TQLDAAVVTRYLDALERKIRAVNERLAEMNVKDLRLSSTHHLTGKEQRFMQALFTNRPRRELLHAFMPLAAALLADDLYGPLRKGLGLVANLGAILLPVRFRATWLTRMLHNSALRRTVQTLYEGGTDKRMPTAS